MANIKDENAKWFVYQSPTNKWNDDEEGFSVDGDDWMGVGM